MTASSTSIDSVDILDSDITVHQGAVIEVGDGLIWIKRSDGREVSIRWPGASGADFRVGHEIKVATITRDGAEEMAKALNVTTNRLFACNSSMVTRLKDDDVPGVISAGMLFLKEFNAMLFISLFFPFISGVTAIPFLMGLPRLVGSVRGLFRHILTGIAAFFAWAAVFGGLNALTNVDLFGGLAFMAPLPGLVIAYGLIFQTMLYQWAEATDKVDAKLLTVAA